MPSGGAECAVIESEFGLLSRLLLLALLSLLPLLPSLASAQPRFTLAETQTILPKDVLPLHVRLSLDLDPDQASFGGHVEMRLRVLRPVPAIVLHARELEAQSLTLLDGRRARPLRLAADPEHHLWRLEPVDGLAIAAGAHRLVIDYRGKVQTSGEGLYLVEHRVQGRSARMLATQLEEVHARRVVPNFDEPVFRSVFEVDVRAPPGYEVLSNMPRLSATQEVTALRHRFAATPPMPSYLLAVSVGRFDVLEDRVEGIPLRIFTAPGKREQARYAMQATRQLLPYYARYFGRPFALPKLDQMAVPGTRQGAMEDWGLISYVENALLFDPARSDPETQRRVFHVVAHEIAHQWFGDLVSIASWNEIWLNEAFATWMEHKAAARFHPEWQTVLGVRRELDRTMERDATTATRAIRSGPVSEASVFAVFDGITYNKGGAVLTMLEQWIGADAFQRGLAAYMRERALQPATAGDLWHHIGRAAGKPVNEVAASWTDQPGVPLLDVTLHCEAGTTQIDLRQSRFSLGEPLAGGPWQLPVRLARGKEVRTVLMSGAEQRVAWPGCDAEPLLANAGGAGYYRVRYDAASQARLAAAFPALGPADRVALLSDSFALVLAGQRSVAEHVAVLAALPRVNDASRAALFMQASMQWGLLEATFDGTPAQAAIRAAGQALFAPELARLGWQPAAREDSETTRLRGKLIERLAALDDEATCAAARQRCADALSGKTAQVPASIRAAVLWAVGVQAGDDEFAALLGALRSAESEEERWQLAEALAAGRDAGRARRLLDEALSGRLPPNMSAALPGMVGRARGQAPLAYQFVRDHWSALALVAGEGPFGGRHWLLPGSAWWSNEPGAAQQLLDDQQRLSGAAGASTAAQAAAAIEVRQRLRGREAATLAQALDGVAPR